MNINDIDKLKSIFYDILKIDGSNDFNKLEQLTEQIISILIDSKYEIWKKLKI